MGWCIYSFYSLDAVGGLIFVSRKLVVSIVVNAFSDRLHSSWLWSVLPFFAVGSYLSWLSKIITPPQTELIEGEQADAYLGLAPAHVPFHNELATLIGI